MNVLESRVSTPTDEFSTLLAALTALRRGDATVRLPIHWTGVAGKVADVFNDLVDQNATMAAELARLRQVVGKEGKLKQRVSLPEARGFWGESIECINALIDDLVHPTSEVARVIGAVAQGDLSMSMALKVEGRPLEGEFLRTAKTINKMVEQLANFSAEVTRVAREVGTEGKLGGQAKVKGVAGTWKDLTDSVNSMAGNLTTQVRAIAEVATAVTQGDLTRSITVKAQGEVAALKDTINEMIRNLKDTTQKNTEQDWLKTNLAKLSRMLQGQKDLVTVGQLILSELAPVVGALQAEFYVLRTSADVPRLRLLASYASGGQQTHGKEVALGQGLSESAALDVLVLPVVFEGQVRGVLELASLDRFNPAHQAFLDQLTESIGIVINTIEANTRTEDLLTQSQSLAGELQSRQQELQQTNEELQEKARLLAHQNHEVERKNQEVEQARQALEEKAEQLALTSKYKSEFLANMSHELRTPLNSLLILSDQLCKNPDGNLTNKQVEFSKTIHSSGNDLLMLINDILDLAKIESGTVAVDVSELRLDDLHRSIERGFRHFAETKHIDFLVSMDQPLPKMLVTDVKRLQQIIKNLLSNAFKFTHEGDVAFSMSVAEDGWSLDNHDLNSASQVIAFSVSDTGIGISADKQQIIFEAFQQADRSTSRKYGGTGLGLAISRELSRLLGGEIRLVSAPTKGSTFTLYLPQSYNPARIGRQARSVSVEGKIVSAEIARRIQPSSLPAPSSALPPARPSTVATADEEIGAAANEVGDDRGSIVSGDKVLLIVENDMAFAKVMLDAARQSGFKGLVSRTGAGALSLTKEFHPSVIALDIHLPDMLGWRILDRLKNDLGTRHIPICVVSADDARERALHAGAVAFIAKPLQSKDQVDKAVMGLYLYTQRTRKKLLVAMRPGHLLGGFRAGIEDDTEVVVVQDAQMAREAMVGDIDCMVIDPQFVNLGPEDVIDALEQRDVPGQLPVIVFAASKTDDERGWLRQRPEFAVRQTASLDGLLAFSTFFLHRGLAEMSEAERRSVETIYEAEGSLAGKKALIVDDDMRNIFALATVLDGQGMRIVSADNGREAIQLVESDPDIDVVLMDIMMPEMDGIATMREIRLLGRGKDLPMVAVTAKAMKGDRQKCIEAGAWDYLSKPVDPVNLLAMLRGWLCN